eukprot:TRINITY_DN49495_c0_g1_i1.p1 TRINITY_DN49495_c0_g1~~TRINITY_DN49495_c0_g1_i1.p1  ORF type:complete len:248 (-),score=38.02 TRINITY_DN49495_c0_g1_i1:493-1236(-)
MDATDPIWLAGTFVTNATCGVRRSRHFYARSNGSRRRHSRDTIRYRRGHATRKNGSAHEKASTPDDSCRQVLFRGFLEKWQQNEVSDYEWEAMEGRRPESPLEIQATLAEKKAQARESLLDTRNAFTPRTHASQQKTINSTSENDCRFFVQRITTSTAKLEDADGTLGETAKNGSFFSLAAEITVPLPGRMITKTMNEELTTEITKDTKGRQDAWWIAVTRLRSKHNGKQRFLRGDRTSLSSLAESC